MSRSAFLVALAPLALCACPLTVLEMEVSAAVEEDAVVFDWAAPDEMLAYGDPAHLIGQLAIYRCDDGCPAPIANEESFGAYGSPGVLPGLVWSARVEDYTECTFPMLAAPFRFPTSGEVVIEVEDYVRVDEFRPGDGTLTSGDKYVAIAHRDQGCMGPHDLAVGTAIFTAP